MVKRSVRAATILIISFVVAFTLGWKRLLLAMGDFLVVEDELRAADVIHVISGPDERTDYAIQLYKQGYGELIFFTGGWCIYHNYYHGQHGRERALEQGVHPEAIAIDETWVTSTYSEAIRLQKFIRESPVPLRSVILVSDPYHMRRARWAYQQVLGSQIVVWMAPVPFRLSTYRRYWWTDQASRRYVKKEYLKIAYYFVRYRLTWGPAKDWLASFDQY